ncbi:hypothetical protein ARMSODRAFT_602033 [Armillaria solidipes]|uniref:RRM domain-containing protein n=1 Tax=Armillaria solidipes TaxID=1076256 RepID=A0A2H3AVE4_9AGAR|nr:hypothetical protein ARMSODRAFT_602033 [Armillaria solidipes]
MLRIGSALRCLRAARLPSASYATAAGPASLQRTVRVENLPSGYDVGSIVEAIKGNPSEAIVPSKDHLLVRFFDEYTARRCVEVSNGVQNLSLKIDESASAPLDDATIAKLVKFDLTRTVRLSNIPKSLSEYDLKQTLSKYEGGRGVHRLEGHRCLAGPPPGHPPRLYLSRVVHARGTRSNASRGLLRIPFARNS